MLEMAPTAPEPAPVSRLAAHPAACGMPCTKPGFATCAFAELEGP